MTYRETVVNAAVLKALLSPVLDMTFYRQQSNMASA